jgi:C4-dicarboxylate-specific signal transduction histidine kinase
VSTIAAAERLERDRRFGDAGASDIPQLRGLFKEMQEKLRSTEMELHQSEPLAMTGRMVQCISHDLRHHLSAIYASAEVMSEQRTPQADRETLLEEVSSAITCMTGMLDSLLLFAQTGRKLHPKLWSIQLLIEHTAKMIRMHPDAQNVELVIREVAPLECRMDCKKLGSAVYNLLLNACQAANRGPSPRRVEVKLSEDQKFIDIRIEDSGSGVPDSIRKTLFEPFVTTDKAQGIGLGLTIAQLAAQEHGGVLYLEESGPGNTVFVLHLSKRALAGLTQA